MSANESAAVLDELGAVVDTDHLLRFDHERGSGAFKNVHGERRRLADEALNPLGGLRSKHADHLRHH